MTGLLALPAQTRVSSDRRRALTIVLGLIAIISTVVIWWHVHSSQMALGADSCLKAQPLRVHTILLIDRTDPITQNEKDYLRQLVRRETKDLLPYAKFSIYSIDGTGSSLPSLLFSGCSPGTAETTNVLTRSPDKVQADFERRFYKPIDTIIQDLDIRATAPTSPIIETLQALTLLKGFTDDVSQRHIDIFSDMLQQTAYSQYRDPIDYAKVKASKFYPSIKTRLSGISITVHYIQRPRDARFQGQTHLLFWRDFFADASAKAEFVMVGH